VFQSTRPRGARRRQRRGIQKVCSFNPRARVGRDAPEVKPFVAPEKFQSTRPRGARPLTTCSPLALLCRFNPRARVGREETLTSHLSLVAKFQSTRPRGARLAKEPEKWHVILFQSTRPRGARRNCAHY